MGWAGGTHSQTQQRKRQERHDPIEGFLRMLRIRWEKNRPLRGEAEWEKVECRYRKKVEKENRKMGLV